MRMFCIKGFSGLMMFLLGLVGVVSLVFLLPTSFVMVLWNALVFEGFSGPEIDMGQALILWAAILVMLNILLKPDVSFQFKRFSNSGDVDRHLKEWQDSQKKK